jgi:VCBS repeat-containing protein
MSKPNHGTTVSIAHTPQAKDDVVSAVEDHVLTIDVMGNDLAGNGKHLYSVDQADPLNPLASSVSTLGATITIENGEITYDSSHASALQALGEGETATDTFSYVIQMGNGALSVATVTVTVTGANDAPAMSADVTAVHALSELAATTDSATADTAHASLAFHDLDLSDTHTVTIGAPEATYLPADSASPVALSSLPSAVHGALDSALAGALSSSLTDSTHSGTGAVDLTFSAADKAFDFLAEGETLTVTYDVTVTDDHGGASAQPVVFTITGANDAPVLAADTGVHAIAETDGTTGAAAAHALSGSLSFTDADLSDTHTVAIGAPTAVWSNGTAPAATVADLAGALTYDLTDSTHTGAGAVALGFSAPDDAFDFLAAGETLTVTYDVTVTDDHDVASTKPVTLTVTGANDTPVLAADAGAHAFTETEGATADATAHTLGAALTFTDADLSDTHAVTIGDPTAVWSNGATPAATLDALTGALTSTLTDSTDTGAGSVALAFSATDSAFDFLSAGETLQVTYDVTVTDDHGVQSAQPVTITVTGTNDAPTVTSAVASADITEDLHAPGPETATGVIAFADADLSDAHTAAAVFDPLGDAAPLGALTPVVTTDADGHGEVAWTYSADESAVQHLAQGQSVVETFTVTVDDGHGGEVSQDVSVTLHGVNDAPQIGGPADFSVQEAAGALGSNAHDIVTAILPFTDVDLLDTHTVAADAAPLSVTATGGLVVPEATLSALSGALSAGAAADATNGGEGLAALVFSAPDSAFDFLPQGQSLTVTYNLSVTDDHGASATEPVSFTIVGTNDVPVVSGPLALSVAEDGGVNVVGALANAHDADQGTVLNVVDVGTLPAGVSYDAATQAFALDTGDTAFQHLAAGETQTVTVDYSVSDGLAQPVATSLSWTVAGTNDAPELAAGPNLSGAISFYGAEGNAVDTIGANNGTSHGAIYAPGHDGQAFDFTGSNFVTIPNEIPANFTIEGWLKTDADSLTGAQFFQGNGLVYADVGGLQKDFGISILNDHLAFGTGGNFDSTIQSTSAVTTGDWVNFAAVRDGSVISIYINGQLEASEDTTYSGLLNAPAQITLGANTIDGRFFTGELDDLSIYNRALSGTEIQQHAVLGSATLVEPSGVTGGSTPLAGSVSLTLTDADLSDTHTTTISAPVLSWSGGEVPATVANALADVASAAVTTDSTGTGAGAVTVSFGAPQGVFDFLAAGQTLTATYSVGVSDGHGGAATQPVTFTVVGTNDAAAISGAAAGVVQEDGALTAGGTLALADPDAGESHFQTLSDAALHGTYGVFTFDDGQWGYTLDNDAANVQALAGGQTVHDTLTVTSQDGTAAQTIDVAIGGQNEPQFLQLLQNNSFEDGNIDSFTIPGWTNQGGTFMEIAGQGFQGIAGSDGHMLDTQGTPGGITIAQTIDVPTGEHATLSFNVAAELDGVGRHPNSTLTFTWDGQVVASIKESDFIDSNGQMHWDQLKTFSFDVVGHAGGDTLTIHDSGTGLVGYALDWVKVEAWVVG